MRIGKTHFAGAQAWPDHILSTEAADILFGVVVEVWDAVFGIEVHRGIGGNPWAGIYLGWWAFGIYCDRDGSWAEA